MKMCDDVITVFTARVDPETGDAVWEPTVINGVSWFATDASTVDASRGGLVAANKCTVRIPAEVLPDGLAIRGGDILVRGDASCMDPRPAAIRAEYPDAVTVLAVTDNRRAPRAPHIRVTGT